MENSELITVELLRICYLPVLLYAIESFLPRVCDINSLNNCINVAVAKIFKVSFNNVDFIRQMTALTSLRVLVAEKVNYFIRLCLHH